MRKRPCTACPSTLERGRLRHHHRLQRGGQVHPVQRRGRECSMWTRGASSWAGGISPSCPSTGEAAASAGCSRTPCRGTAPHMTIEENLALAYLRSAKGNPFSRISQKDKALFPGAAGPAGHGAGGPDEPAGGPALRRPAPGPHPAHGHPGPPPAAAAGRAHRRPGPRPPRTRCWSSPEQIVARENITCLMVTHNMHQALDAGQPHPDDGRRQDRAGRVRRGARRP